MLGTENMQTLLSLCADVWVRLLPITSAAKKQLHCQTPVKPVVQVRHERFVLGNILPVPVSAQVTHSDSSSVIRGEWTKLAAPSLLKFPVSSPPLTYVPPLLPSSRS